jgi:hypothetical protein
MTNQHNLTTFLEQIKEKEGDAFSLDENAIADAYEATSNNPSSLAIKILSIFGGILGTITFLIALGIAGFFDSEIATLILGFLLLGGAVALNHTVKTIFFDTISISAFVTSFCLIDFALARLEVNESMICLINILMTMTALAFSQNYIYAFISLLIMEISSLFLITLNEAHQLIHLYNLVNIVVLAIWILKESKIITSSKKMGRLYEPFRIGLIFSLLIGLTMIGIKGIYLQMEDANFLWFSSLATMPVILYVIHLVLNILEIEKPTVKGLVFGICVLILACILNAPAISGAIMIILLCFYTNYRTGFAIGIIALAYYIGQYYYDLNLSLLTKSFILMSSGTLFLLLYLLTHQQLNSNEIH